MPVDLFINADAAAALDGLRERLPARLDVEAEFLGEVARARAQSEEQARRRARSLSGRRRCAAGPRRARARIPSCATSRCRTARSAIATCISPRPHLGVHALGGGIGQGIAMAVGAALAGVPAKTVALIGDGGAMVNLGELATAVDSQGGHRLRPDERSRLRRHPQHPGRAVRRPPPLRRPPHAGFRAACRGARPAASAGLAHRGVRGGARSRLVGERSAARRGGHGRDRAVRRGLCRPARRRGRKC